MRPPIDRLRVHYFLVKLGMAFRYPARLYLVGGATLVYEGLREQSLDIDIDYELAPEHGVDQRGACSATGLPLASQKI